MRTSTRLVVSAVVLGGGLLVSAPASAQVACAYPHDCLPIGGGEEVAAEGSSGETGGTPVLNPSAPISTANGGGSASLPMTGGEVTLIALTGVAALGGGALLVAAGRKRETT